MNSTITPQEFVDKWRVTSLGERQSYQLHFSDVCQLVGHQPPDSSGTDEKGRLFQFEKYVKEEKGERGFADVYYEKHFAIEYKAPNRDKNLDDAFKQLQRYQRQLKIPPLLIVTDIQNWRIHTNFNNTVPEVYQFTHAEISEKPEVLQWLKYLFYHPERFNPERNTDRVTEEAASALKAVVDNMRQRWQMSSERVAKFLTRIIFSLFAEDIGLLPTMVEGQQGLFTYLVEHTQHNPRNFKADIGLLFKAMEDGGRMHSRDIRWFNGALFKDVEVERLSPPAINKLYDACLLNWEYVEPAIFGTLFERCLDPKKRAQLGTHYTAPADILLIVEPVLMQPLRKEWEGIRRQAQALREKYNQSRTTREKETAKAELLALRDKMLARVRGVKVLDPACGSGNFLYIALQQLMNLELDIVTDALWHDIDRADLQVGPGQIYGIEIDEIAHALASIVVWIGYIQWREHHGYRYDAVPLLQDLSGNIVCKDAILAFDEAGSPAEPAWPAVDVIVGNPPFLGDKKMRRELDKNNDGYVDRLRAFYSGRVPGGADLVCYWFEKAREQIKNGKAERAGLLATNSIRGGLNREVLKRIKGTGDIFMAWSNREWILDGAAVRVSMVGFDDGTEQHKTLDGMPANTINSDLTASVDVTKAVVLIENKGLSFVGVQKSGPFDIDRDMAQKMLTLRNSSGLDNADVIKPTANARDIVNRPSNTWLIDFAEMPLESAKQYEAPFDYVVQNVKPIRDNNRRVRTRMRWWIHGESCPGMRNALVNLERFICTPLVSKHRIFVWQRKKLLPSNLLIAIARNDDYFFGVLHSKLHELWSLRMGTRLGKGNDPRYTPTTTFQTFPFPWPPGKEDRQSAAYQAISRAAKRLNAERHAWLNLEGVGGRALKERTLTNLYNALQAFRGLDSMKVKAAADFAPRLDELHQALDVAVCAAYGWEPAILDDDEEILRRLLALNLARG